MRSRREFIQRLAWFLSPYVLAGAVIACLVIRSGEFLPVRWVATMQSLGYPFLYGPLLSDRNYAFKQEAATRLRPDILVIGASRMNQWRSAMFSPSSFYNAGNSLYLQADYWRFVQELGEYAPKILIFSLDFYTFNRQWELQFKDVAYDDYIVTKPDLRKFVARHMINRVWRTPSLLLSAHDPVHGVPAIGMEAARSGSGFRIDGSYQYGGTLLGDPKHLPPSMESVLERVHQGAAPFLFHDRMDPDRRSEFEKLATIARERGIKLVAVTMPYAPEVVGALDASPRHGIWREFLSGSTKDWIRAQGVVYFDFTRLNSFGGRADEFVDPFHASEPAYVRMLLTMLRDEEFRALVPAIDESLLRKILLHSSRLEAYRNLF